MANELVAEPDLQFTKDLIAAGRRRPEEVLPVCYVFGCVSYFSGQQSLSAQRDDLGAVGLEEETLE